MAKYQFRLATLQRLRETHRDELRTQLAEAYHAEQLLQQRVAAIHDEEAQLREANRRSLADGKADVNRLLDGQRYAATLKGQLATLAEQHKMLAGEIEKRRQAVVEADKQVKVLEKLHDRQLASYRREQLLAEAKELDEIGSHMTEVDY